ncbi:MAG: hypothetical protein ABSF90_07205 [Syntrophobacteraceae bacterium]|jgi:hypothetical protein
MQNQMIAMLQDVITYIDQGDPMRAYQELQNDVLRRTDGCALYGAPDSDDWIIDAPSQGAVHPPLTGIITELQ